MVFQCAVERGLPFLGIALTAIKPDFPDKLEHVFEKHQSDSIILNLGPYGKFFATQSIPDMQEVSVVKASDVYTKWPGANTFLILLAYVVTDSRPCRNSLQRTPFSSMFFPNK